MMKPQRYNAGAAGAPPACPTRAAAGKHPVAEETARTPRTGTGLATRVSAPVLSSCLRTPATLYLLHIHQVRLMPAPASGPERSVQDCPHV